MGKHEQSGMESKENPTIFELSIFCVFLSFCISSELVTIVKILKLTWANLETINVHQVNYFTGLALINSSGIHLIMSRVLDEPLSFCPAHLLSHLFLLSNKYDIIILQLDRLLAIWKPYYYREYVDVKVTVKFILASKLFCMLIVLLSSIIDPYFLYCPACGKCTFLKTIYVYTVSYSAIAAFILTVSVSIYVFIIVNKLNTIQPQVSLPINNQINDDLHGNQTIFPAERNPEVGICSNTNKFNEDIQTVSKTCMEQNEFGLNEEIHVLNMIREIEQNPDPTNDGHHEIVPSTKRNVTETQTDILYKTLKMNLFTLAILFMSVPTSILNIIYKNCDHLSGECVFYFDTMIASSLCELVICFLQPLVFIFFLEQNI